jgi:hypothetical protein
VVETAMRVPAGDAVHRAYAVQVPDGHVVVVEVENKSSIPFALAWAVRPFTAAGPGRLASASAEGEAIQADGVAAVLLDRYPGRVASAADRDIAEVVFAGEAGSHAPLVVSDIGLAQAVAIVPVPHRATVRVVLPLDSSAALPDTFPPVLPSAADVASGWSVHVDTDARVVLPEGPIADAVDRSRRRLLLGATELRGPAPAVVGRGEPLLTVSVVDALLDNGHDTEAARLLASWFLTSPMALGSVAPALVSLERYWRATGDDALVRAAREQVRDGVAAIAEVVRRKRADLAPALLVWAAAALRAGGALLRVVGDERAAGDSDTAALHAGHERDAALHALAEASATAERAARAAAVVAAAALGALAPAHVEMSSILEAASGVGTESDPLASIDLAAVEIQRGDPRGYDRLERVVALASGTGTWLDGGDGDLEVAARLLRTTRRLAVAEPADGSPGAVLCPLWPTAWLGRGLEVHGARIGGAALSFAVRWHGERPAVLGDVAGGSLALASGLDPSWRVDDARGDALLAAPAPAPPPPLESTSFS